MATAIAQANISFWDVNTCNGAPICYCANLRLENTFDDFMQAIDGMPRFLEKVCRESLPLVIIAPEQLDGFSPLAHEAPAIEGARTALAWARAYFQENECRFSLRILKVSNDNTAPLAALIQCALEQPAITSLEDNLAPHMISYSATNLTQQSDNLLLIAHDYSGNAPKQETLATPTLFNAINSPCYLVAGGSGFIGYHIVKALLEKGYRVIVVDNNRCSNKENLDEFLSNPRLVFTNHDITVPFTVQCPLDGIINLASIPSPAFYYHLPCETLRVGLQGSINLLNLARVKNARYLFTSTSEVYGDPLVHPQTEDYAGRVAYLGKRSQYDQSKRGAETLLKLYFEHYHLDIRIARLFNTYGPPMMLHDGRVVTNFIANIMDGKPLVIYGDGTQTRSFGYVEDTVAGLLSLLCNESLSGETLITNRVFNVGTPLEISVNELAQKADELCYKKYGRHAIITHVPTIDKTDPYKRLPDITRAKAVLGFSPRITIEDGLEKTWEYFSQKLTRNDSTKL